MRRFALLLFVVLAAFAGAIDYDPHGIMTFKDVKVRQADGTYKTVPSLKVPFYAEPVGETRRQIEKMIGGPIPPNQLAENPSDALVTVYQNDRPNNYFGGTAEGPMPSALDDVQIIGAGVNAGVLSQITVGWHIPNRNSVFVVFGFYDNFVPGQGSGVSAFSNILVDSFGGPFSAGLTQFPSVPGEYMVTFGFTIQLLGIQFPDEYCYFFQQFRNGSYLGPFNDNWFMFFSGGGMPQVGASQDQFYFDANPEDGIYSEDEVDLFSTEPGHPFQANFAMKLAIDSNITFTDLAAAALIANPGYQVSGSYTSTWTSNNIHFVARPELVNADYDYPLEVLATTDAGVNQLASLQFTLESKMNHVGCEQVINLFNYTLGVWQEFDRRLLGTTDTPITFSATGDPSSYVNPLTNEMMALIQYRELASEEGDFRASIDQIKWRIGTN